jgi:hypothetical protein
MIYHQGVGLSSAEGDARYVPRFVGGIETGRAALQEVSSGVEEPTLSNPNGAVMGGFPTDTSPSLFDAGDGGRFATRLRIVRVGNAAVMVCARAAGTLQAPTALGSGLAIGGLNANPYHGTGYVTAGLAVFNTREAVTPTAAGSTFQIQVCDIGGVTLKAAFTARGGGAGVSEWQFNEATGRILPTTAGQLRNPANTATALEWNATGLGVFGATPVARSAAIANAAGGATVDAEARTALNALLAYLRTFGLITP